MSAPKQISVLAFCTVVQLEWAKQKAALMKEWHFGGKTGNHTSECDAVTLGETSLGETFG